MISVCTWDGSLHPVPFLPYIEPTADTFRVLDCFLESKSSRREWRLISLAATRGYLSGEQVTPCGCQQRTRNLTWMQELLTATTTTTATSTTFNDNPFAAASLNGCQFSL